MRLTKEQLIKVMPYSKKRVDTFLEHLNDAMEEFQITDINAIRMFIAQLAVESGEFLYVEEIASGKAYDTGQKAINLGNTPEADGDGQFYKGRGLIQITGRRNYILCGAALDLDLINHPELLTDPKQACRSAAWYWYNTNLNRYSEPTEDNFKTVTRRINGGYTHLAERKHYWELAKKYII